MSPRLTGWPVGARPAVPLLFLPREIPHFEVRAQGWLHPFSAQRSGESLSKAVCSRVGPTCLRLRVCEGFPHFSGLQKHPESFLQDRSWALGPEDLLGTHCESRPLGFYNSHQQAALSFPW